MKTQEVRKVGFWNDNKNRYPEFPMPVARDKPWKGRRDFLEAFRQLDQKIRKREVSFLRVTAFKGHSTCRCCGVQNGMHEIEYKSWIWPEGFMHYVEKHNVKPPQDFIDFIMAEIYGDKIKQVMNLPINEEKHQLSKKPKVDALFNAHTRYQSRIMQAAHYNTSVTEYKRLFKEAQLAFKKDLEEMGLADRLDWSDME